MQRATAGFRFFHDRVTIFIDAELAALRETGLWNGGPIGIVFLGITNRWSDAWELTQDNFRRGQPAVVVPTYNLL